MPVCSLHLSHTTFERLVPECRFFFFFVGKDKKFRVGHGLAQVLLVGLRHNLSLAFLLGFSPSRHFEKQRRPLGICDCKYVRGYFFKGAFSRILTDF